MKLEQNKRVIVCVARLSARFCVVRSVAVNDAPLHIDGSAGRLHRCTTMQGASPRTHYPFLLSETLLQATRDWYYAGFRWR